MEPDLYLDSCGDIKSHRFWHYDLTFLGSRDVIGHVTIGLIWFPICYSVKLLLFCFIDT